MRSRRECIFLKTKQVVGIVIAVVVFVLAGFAGVASANSLRNNINNFTALSDTAISDEPYNSLAVINIVGEIAASSGTVTAIDGYDQNFILDYIDEMTNSYNNTGIILYIDSPGGAVYQTDEVYQALMNYKEVTGRPIYSYSADYMASGAYYIACASDRIVSNRNSWVGSIGVYLSTMNYKGLFDKLGIKPEYIKSGENKAMGNGYDELTDEQRAIYQGLVDESYEQFLDIVCTARGYSREEALPICDGRVYTAAQGLSNGLIDEIIDDYDVFEQKCLEESGASQCYYKQRTVDNWLSYFWSSVEALVPKSETEIMLEEIEKGEGGVLMYHAG